MDFEIKIIQLLKDGYTQKEIPEQLQLLSIKPNSISSVEKCINRLKEQYKANTLFHLACILFKIKDSDIDEIEC